jgi:hypothetical protein
MSRGFGHIERAILQILTEGYVLDSLQLAAMVFERQPNDDGVCIVTPAEIVSVRRAARHLHRKGTGVGPEGLNTRRQIWSWIDWNALKPRPRWQPVVIQGGKI